MPVSSTAMSRSATRKSRWPAASSLVSSGRLQISAPTIVASTAAIRMSRGVEVVPTKTRAFYLLPNEMNKTIADYIDNDKDFCNFQLVCHATYDAVNSDQSAWRERFVIRFNRTTSISYDFKSKYQAYAHTLRSGAYFTGGYTPHEQSSLEILRSLILESEGTRDNHYMINCMNFDRLREFSISTNILSEMLHSGNLRPSPPLATIQVLLTPFFLDVNMNMPTFGFPSSQSAAYLGAGVSDGVLFCGKNNLQVNTAWLLHIGNFFKYHMTRKEEYSLFDEYMEMKAHEKPQMWVGKLGHHEPGLDVFWKGAYAYLDAADVLYLRQAHDMSTDIFIDNMDGFQDMTLNPIGSPPKVTEQMFKLLDRQANRAKKINRAVAEDLERKSLYYEATGFDHQSFYACIRVRPLPLQCGVPGFQRFSMVKHFIHTADDLWAYEGCVLPGKQMILGRWFYLDTDPTITVDGGAANRGSGPYSGPFIFWNVHKPNPLLPSCEDLPDI